MCILFWGLNCLNILFPVCLYGMLGVFCFIGWFFVIFCWGYYCRNPQKYKEHVFKQAWINHTGSVDFMSKQLQMQNLKFILAMIDGNFLCSSKCWKLKGIFLIFRKFARFRLVWHFTDVWFQRRIKEGIFLLSTLTNLTFTIGSTL